jgi:hypothetical protein
MHYGTAHAQWRALSYEHQAPNGTERCCSRCRMSLLPRSDHGSGRAIPKADRCCTHGQLGWLSILAGAMLRARHVPYRSLRRSYARRMLVSLSKGGSMLVLMQVAVSRRVLDEVNHVFGVQSDGEHHHVGQRTAIVEHQSTLPSLPPPCGLFHQTSSVHSYFHPDTLTRSQTFEDTAYLQLVVMAVQVSACNAKDHRTHSPSGPLE